jgi:transposase
MIELSRKQEKVLIDLLNGLTITDASKANGISETTVYKWLNADAFKTEYRRLRREAVESSVAKLQTATNEAVETLRRNLNCESPSVEIRSAQIILDNAIKSIEMIDISERLDRLESMKNEVKL